MFILSYFFDNNDSVIFCSFFETFHEAKRIGKEILKNNELNLKGFFIYELYIKDHSVNKVYTELKHD